MPLGGATILWNEASPAEADVADAGPIRSIETSIRNAMGSEHNWPASGGANTGYHLFGSARPFYDVQSNVSSSGSDGRIMFTSDTSRLFGVGSGGTVFVGGPGTLSHGSFPGGAPPQRSYWAIETGVAQTGTITFPNSGFSGVPFTMLSVWTANSQAVTALIQGAPSATAVTYLVYQLTGSSQLNVTSIASVMWMSVGTRTL